MTDQTTAPDIETQAAAAPGFPLARTLVWLGIAGASATVTYLVLRTRFQRRPPGDETAERIQALIDEANRLIKTLDEKKPAP